MKSNNQYQQKHLQRDFQQNNNSENFLTITSEEIEASLSLLFKIGIQADMKKRGINKFEDYVDVLVKEYPSKVPTNPLP